MTINILFHQYCFCIKYYVYDDDRTLIFTVHTKNISIDMNNKR